MFGSKLHLFYRQFLFEIQYSRSVTMHEALLCLWIMARQGQPVDHGTQLGRRTVESPCWDQGARFLKPHCWDQGAYIGVSLLRRWGSDRISHAGSRYGYTTAVALRMRIGIAAPASSCFESIILSSPNGGGSTKSRRSSQCTEVQRQAWCFQSS